jgi:diguanylate cyclase (GGDEF)-like protein
MDKQLETRLKLLVSFPSPPGVAQQIILLANDPDVQISAVAQTISSDPGLAAKVLRIANSALYARRRRSDNLRQALTALGLGAVTTLALGFSIAPFFRKGDATGLDYNRCWRRALMGALAARTLGERIRIDRTEDLFLAGLMQDLGMLALDRAKLGFYAAMPIGTTHDEACKYETERLGTDHAVVGGWLLKEWRLPDLICSSIAASHAPETTDGATEAGRFTRCLGLAGAIADFFLSDHRDQSMAPLEAKAQALLGLDPVETSTVIATIVDLLPDVEKLFDTQLMDTADMQSLVDQARELLTLRSLESLEKVTDLEAKASELEQRTEILQDQSRQDALTRVYNRGHLEKVLAEEFADALANGTPLSVIFIDLDHFKNINDTYGHAAGDDVLRATAQVLLRTVRSGDHVARYGGEEFVIVLPGLEVEAGRALCGRINQILRQATHCVGTGNITVTASLGIATHGKELAFSSVQDLVKAADEAVYRAKHAGRDRFACHMDAVETQLKSAGGA